MKINELQPRQGKVELVATIIDIGQSRTFDKGGAPGRVANATIKDETGSVKLSLWNEQIEQVHVGDMIKISNGYVSEFRGEMQLSTGKFGKLEVTGAGVVTDTPVTAPAHKAEPVESAPAQIHRPAPAQKQDDFSDDGDDDSDHEEESGSTVEEEDVM